jgi:pyruvate,water dikinase
VVTEQGSIAGHLANVCREFGVPSLFGVDGAMTRLENGRTVTVDADGLRIYEGRVEELLVQTEKPRNLMEGTFDAPGGRRADPSFTSSTLTPAQTKAEPTISRDSATKISSGMFRSKRAPSRAFSKQRCDMPMQVARIDDGFGGSGREDVNPRTSSPFHAALWEGLGQTVPPACGRKRLMSAVRGHEKHGLVTGGRSMARRTISSFRKITAASVQGSVSISRLWKGS